MVFIGYSNTNDERDAARQTDLVAVGRVRNPRPTLGPAARIVGWVRAAVSRFLPSPKPLVGFAPWAAQPKGSPP